MRKTRFQVKCTDCGRVLQKNGQRSLSYTFDSEFPSKPMTKYRVYAHCDKCYSELLKGKM